jgi:hypothetical protein
MLDVHNEIKQTGIILLAFQTCSLFGIPNRTHRQKLCPRQSSGEKSRTQFCPFQSHHHSHRSVISNGFVISLLLTF